MKIKVFEKSKNCLPVTFKQGDWIDLRTSEDVILQCPYAKTLRRIKNNEKEEGDTENTRLRDIVFCSTLIKLGVCMEIPKGYEAILVPRSSTFKRYGIMQTNSIGIIDNEYSSEEDEWMMPVIATKSSVISAGTRIAQFRIQLSQKATVWQKIKWLFSSSVKLEKVEHLNNATRGGFGSTETKTLKDDSNNS